MTRETTKTVIITAVSSVALLIAGYFGYKYYNPKPADKPVEPEPNGGGGGLVVPPPAPLPVVPPPAPSPYINIGKPKYIPPEQIVAAPPAPSAEFC